MRPSPPNDPPKDVDGPRSNDQRRARRRRVTLSQIAAHLRVSTATVSLALRDSPAVAEETRRRVQAIAGELGYIYNRQAASLRTARTYIVGVVVHDVLNPYFAEIFQAIETELEQHRLTILMCNHHDDVARQRTFVSVLQQQNADGLIICPSVDTTADEIDRLLASGMPMTMMCREVEGVVDVPMVRGDDFQGMLQMTGHLIEAGHRHIVMVGGRPQISSSRDRAAGYFEAMRQAGLEGVHISEASTQKDGLLAVDAILARDPRPTAAVCFNDRVAFGVMAGLTRHGLRPGVDMAVTGYDDVDGADATTPSLTTVRNGSADIGREAARAIHAAIEGYDPPFQRLLIQPHLAIRESAPAPLP
jgi:DNA-binding LacI/PurR family transcriptional regulator